MFVKGGWCEPLWVPVVKGRAQDVPGDTLSSLSLLEGLEAPPSPKKDTFVWENSSQDRAVW